MVNYIRAEFYKVFRRRYTWITLVVLLALEALMVAGWMFTNSHGNHVDFYTGAGMLCVMLALGFYATLLTCDMVFADQYKNGTMKNEVSFGIPRTRIYLGKFLVSLAVSLLFMAVMAAFYLGLCYLALFHDPEADAVAMQMVGYCLLTALPLWVGVLACTCAFRFLIKSDLWASVASVCVFAVIPPVMEVCMARCSAPTLRERLSVFSTSICPPSWWTTPLPWWAAGVTAARHGSWEPSGWRCSVSWALCGSAGRKSTEMGPASP